jgi:hypothetical protein
VKNGQNMKRRVAQNAPSIKYGAKGDLGLSTIRRKTPDEGNDANQGRHVFLFYKFFGGFSLEKIILRITIYSIIFIFMTVTDNIYPKQIQYHVFNAVTNSELTFLLA